MLQKEDNNWVKKCLEYEVDGAKPTGRPKKLGERLWKKTVMCKLNREDPMDCIRWMKQKRDD